MRDILHRYRKYKGSGVKISYLEGYSDEDEYILFNEDDKDLDTIKVKLPPTPDWDKIDGFGLHPEEQMFQRVEIPMKLLDLEEMQNEDGAFLTQDEIWQKIEEQPEYFAKEIKWIKTQWYRLINGYWFFNNGKATYIDGWHYRYLNFYELDNGHPEYRDRDRRFFHFARFCKNDPDCYGFVYPKHRREGATYKTSCINYDIISTTTDARGGIQSMTDKSATDTFQIHIVNPWRKMPFFLKPNHNCGDDPKSMLTFKSSASRGKKGIKRRSKKSLNSDISFRPSVETAYDGTKLHFYHNEEAGKCIEVDVNERWAIAQLCLSTGAGANIHGFSIHTSTVGEMETGGGEAFRELCEGSMYGKRDENNRTATGLYVLFIPAYDGLEGYIDRYGMSVIDTPTKEQAKFLGKTIGAKQYIENTIEGLKKLKSKKKLLAFQRQHPTTYRGCFRSNVKDPFFDIAAIEERLDELKEHPELVTKGNFEWVGQPYRSNVRFIPDEHGRFSVSKQLDAKDQNRIFWDPSLESYVAENDNYCAGGDPFKFDKTKGKRKSNGGGAVFWGHDIRIDPMNKPVNEWISNRFVCTYTFRPDTKEEYGDDMIKMCVYYGCPMNPETNVEFLREWFDKKGFGGMLVHLFTHGKFESLGGKDTSEKVKQKIFNLTQSYIKYHVHRDCHEEYLKECRDIKGVDDMTNWDLFTACGYAMMGIENYLDEKHKTLQDNGTQNVNAAWFEEFSY